MYQRKEEKIRIGNLKLYIKYAELGTSEYSLMVRMKFSKYVWKIFDYLKIKSFVI